MEKDTLIRLWMAHGYIVPLNDDPMSLEDLGEDYFSILLRRCFLQDVKKDKEGNIVSCKMHDLMHDLAQQVVGKEICRVESMNGDLDKKVRHLSLIRLINNFSFTNNKSHLRSFLHTLDVLQHDPFRLDLLSVDALVGNLKYLRALHLRMSGIKSLLGSIGDLIHLRYLDLWHIEGLEVLPRSITKLYNLQTLKLKNCVKLKELPKDLSKLVKLRVLHLYWLSYDIWKYEDEIVMSFKEFSLGDEGYEVRMPSGARDNYNLATFLPNLVQLCFIDCQKLQHLGQLQLPQLKTLLLYNCPNLKAILECRALEVLKLKSFNERLKIIAKSGGDASSYENGLNLREVTIDNVAWLNSLPINSFQEGAKLVISWDNKVESLGEAMEVFRSCSPSLKYLQIINCEKLKSVVRGGLEHLSALEELVIAMNCDNLSESEEVERVSFCQSLRTLELSSLSEMVEVPNWIQYLSALQTLHIWHCEKVESMPNWMSKLTSLRELKIGFCSARLQERCQESTGEDWPHIQHIPSIEFYNCDY